MAEHGTLVRRAAIFAEKAHRGQTRKYHGGPYIAHPMRVALRLMERPGFGPWAWAAAWLHDVVEDCEVSIDEIREQFGDGVARLVQELTNPSRFSSEPRVVRKRMDREHMAGASHDAKTIKVLDRIDNLHEMEGCDEKFGRLYKQETVLLLEAIGRDVAPDLYDELMALAKT